MIEKQTCDTFISTLLYSWGGDTPPEALWALTDFVNWINLSQGLSLEIPTEEDYKKDDDTFCNKVKVITDTLDNIDTKEK